MRTLLTILVTVALAILSTASPVWSQDAADPWALPEGKALSTALAELRTRVWDPVGGYTRWLRSTGGPVRGIAVVAHGLNQKPDRMNALAGLLQERGVDVVRVQLHGRPGEEWLAAGRARWQAVMLAAYDQARQEAVRRRVPLYFVGFSLGALVNLDLMNAEEAIRYDRMVLLAPGLGFSLSSGLGLRAVSLGLGSWCPSCVVASDAPEDRRASDSVAAAAFNGVNESTFALAENGLRRSNVPTLVAIDPEDRVVSASALATIIRGDGLDRWRLLHVHPRDAPERDRSRHWIGEPNALGASEWARLREAVLGHLGL